MKPLHKNASKIYAIVLKKMSRKFKPNNLYYHTGRHHTMLTNLQSFFPVQLNSKLTINSSLNTHHVWNNVTTLTRQTSGTLPFWFTTAIGPFLHHPVQLVCLKHCKDITNGDGKLTDSWITWKRSGDKGEMDLPMWLSGQRTWSPCAVEVTCSVAKVHASAQVRPPMK